MDIDWLANALETATAYTVLAAWIWSLRRRNTEETAYYREELKSCMSGVKDAVNRLDTRITAHIDSAK